jgi:hypothetical protein
MSTSKVRQRPHPASPPNATEQAMQSSSNSHAFTTQFSCRKAPAHSSGMDAPLFRSAVVAILCLLLFCVLCIGCAHKSNAMHRAVGETNATAGDEPAPADSSRRAWAEPDDLVELDRIEWRPGNYAAIGAVVGYLNGAYELRPVLRNVIYPMVLNGTLYEKESQFEDSLRRIESEREEGRSPQNKLRSYVLNFQQLQLVNLKTGDDTLGMQTMEGVDGDVLEHFHKARSFHSGKAVLIRAKIHSESLQSPKIEGDEPNSFEWFLVVHEENGGWYVCMHIW